ncbi:MAG TPA: hypothetical protein VJU14_08870 [Solirubrobacterales bacterium]|nr:hypothetical protein [Solirubrobacterales bacterium]
MPAYPRDPIFLLDSEERFQPLAVESIEEVPATLIGADGNAAGAVQLDSLPEEGGRMNFPPHPEEAEARLRPKHGGVGYRRERKGGGLTWVQYWLWYLYNPKKIFVEGVHEGDWEFVQVGYVDKTPVCMTLSQHRSGGARMWWNVEQRDGRPLVYVARDSHANFFRPVHGVTEWEDEGDGEGEELADLDWRDFGEWADWPGLWGNSTGAGRSPQSPGCQGDRWKAPHRYHSRAAVQL